MTPTKLLLKYVLMHNQGVDSGDFSPMLDLFHEEAELSFAFGSIGCLKGKTQIAEAFIQHPPTDHLIILKTSFTETEVSGVYAWKSNPAMVVGLIRVEPLSRLIKRMFIE